MLGAPAAAAGPVSVVVDGQPVPLSPEPITRTGRVFVPLRGIFERLGATVVYSDGTINATAGNRTISLHIGSTSASVDGEQQGLDVAPFIVGASTYVPLRFISQALGSRVDYDGVHDVVAIYTRPQGPAVPPPQQPPPQQQQPVAQTPPPAAPAESDVRLTELSPGRDASVQSTRPTIAANFSGGRVDPNSVKVTLDDRDITNLATTSPTGIVYSPPSPLQADRHVVRISGTDLAGRPFHLAWAFTSGQHAVENRIVDLSPADGGQVGHNFAVAGRTLPGARVHIVIGASDRSSSGFARILGLGNSTQSTFSYDIVADGSGYFSQLVTLDMQSGATVGLVVTSTDQDTGTSSAPIHRQLTIR